jgi:L-rhamnose mutarotase
MHNTLRFTAVIGWVVVICVAFLAGTLVPAALTQSGTDSQYVTVSYMKVDPAKENAYVQMERKVWKPMHEQLVKDGKMKSWSLYEVRFPGGDNREYGYLTVETYNSIQDVDGSYGDAAYFASLLKKVHPKKTEYDLMFETLNNRTLVRSEVLKLVDQTK